MGIRKGCWVEDVYLKISSKGRKNTVTEWNLSKALLYRCEYSL